MNPFKGYAFQRGSGIGSLFSGLLRVLLPVAKTAGKAIGRQAIKSGAHIASDILDGRNAQEAIMARGKTGAKKLVRRAAKKAGGRKKQRGGAIGRRPAQSGIKGAVQKRRPTKARNRKRLPKKDILGTYLA